MSDIKLELPSAPDTSAIDVQDEGSSVVLNPTAMNFTGPGVTVTENPTGTAEVDIPGLQYWTESEDATTQQSTIFTPNNSATNVNAVIQPKGNGANTAQTPDGTNAGGNARGNYATDWQKKRTNPTEVAAGNESTIGGGAENQATATRTTVAGGFNNVASANNATVIGGESNNSTGQGSVTGGVQNTASGNFSVGLGLVCLPSGSNSAAIGTDVRVSGLRSVSNGFGNTTTSTHAKSSGAGGINKNNFSKTFAAGFRASGDISVLAFCGRTQEGVQIVGFNSRLTGTGNPPTLVTTGGTFYLKPGNEATTTVNANACWNPAKDNQFFTFQIKLLATVTAITGTATGVNVGDVKQWNFEGSGKIVSGTVTILNAGTTDVVIYEDTGLLSMSAQFITGANSTVAIEMTNATFAGGGELELLVNGFLYFQETSLD